MCQLWAASSGLWGCELSIATCLANCSPRVMSTGVRELRYPRGFRLPVTGESKFYSHRSESNYLGCVHELLYICLCKRTCTHTHRIKTFFKIHIVWLYVLRVLVCMGKKRMMMYILTLSAISQILLRSDNISCFFQDWKITNHPLIIRTITQTCCHRLVSLCTAY